MVIDMLLRYQGDGTTSKLYLTGYLSPTAFSHVDAYLFFKGRMKRHKRKNRAVQETADHCKLSDRTVWSIIKIMESPEPEGHKTEYVK